MDDSVSHTSNSDINDFQTKGFIFVNVTKGNNSYQGQHKIKNINHSHNNNLVPYIAIPYNVTLGHYGKGPISGFFYKVNGTWYKDSDGDGYHNRTIKKYSSPLPKSNWSTNKTHSSLDCNDKSKNVNPGHKEICGDDLDNDCDGKLDENCGPKCPKKTKYYMDQDGDGFGNSSLSTKSCKRPPNFAKKSQDCDDSNSSINPNTVWVKDCNGDGYKDKGTISKTQCRKPGSKWILKSNSKGISTAKSCIGISQFYWSDLSQNKITSVDSSKLPQVVNLVSNYTNKLGNNPSISMSLFENLSSKDKHLRTISSSKVRVNSKGINTVAMASFKLKPSFVSRLSAKNPQIYFKSAVKSGLFNSPVRNNSHDLKLTNTQGGGPSRKKCVASNFKSSHFSIVPGSCEINDYANYSVKGNKCTSEFRGDCDYKNLGVVGGVNQNGNINRLIYNNLKINGNAYSSNKNYTKLGNSNITVQYNKSVNGNQSNITLTFKHNFSESELNLRKISVDLLKDKLSGVSNNQIVNRSRVSILKRPDPYFHESLDIAQNLTSYYVFSDELNDSDELCINKKPEGPKDLSDSCSEKHEIIFNCSKSNKKYSCSYEKASIDSYVGPLNQSSILGQHIKSAKKPSPGKVSRGSSGGSSGGSGGSGGGSSGGSGGSGGFSSGSSLDRCTRSDWNCYPSNWSDLDCTNGSKKRNCVKDNSVLCSEGYVPNETKKCSVNTDFPNKSYVNEDLSPTNSKEGVKKSSTTFPWMASLAFIATIIVGLIVSIIYLNYEQKRVSTINSN
ncbi:MAG: putative metal-binding motif-containing protein [Candidatus Pacearchaeota archaeon]